MKRIVKILTLVICFAFLFTMTSCTTTEEGYKSADITKAENLYTLNVKISEENNVVVNTKANDKKFDGVFIAYLDTTTNIYYFENTLLEEEFYGKTLTAVYLKVDAVPKGTSFVGFLEKGEKVKLYTKGSSTTIEGKEAIFVTPEGAEKENSFPKVSKDSLIFSGWYIDEACTFGNRVATVDEALEAFNEALEAFEKTQESESSLVFGVLYARYITFGEGAVVTVICIGIVFLMLALLWGITSILKVVNKKEKKEEVKEQPVVVTEQKKTFTLEDIKDDDMMAAALVATIDYHNETKKDVRVVSIKEIK